MSTWPTSGRRHYNAPPVPAAPNPLTDSGVHRAMLGTRVKLHLHNGTEVEVSLTAIRDVNTWTDLTERIVRGLSIEVFAARRRVFVGGVILWAEVSSDELEDAGA